MTKYLARISLALWLIPAARAVDTTTFWIEPCSAIAVGCQAGDAELARWALAAWEAASEGRLHYAEIKDRDKALLRIRWANKDSGLYGEAVPINVKGQLGSELHILVPEPNPNDPLLRETVVYLTCLHESGHALGLRHTQAFDDIMYSFQFGGDIDEYFGRYRRLLTAREDIRKYAGMSPADRKTLLERIR